MIPRRTRRRWRNAARLALVGGRALVSRRHPVLVHMVVVRRCNLSCTYCNEYDRTSEPVPLDVLKARVDALARLDTSIVTFSGGEPLLHPDLETLIAHAASRGVVPELLTNAYLLTASRIRKLGEAGLSRLQISIDNVRPDDVSMKSLKVLDRKLELLAEHGDFLVNVNSVLGAGVANPEDALVIARRARDLGFSSTVGILHDGAGQLRPLGQAERRVFEEIRSLGGRLQRRFTAFKDNLAGGRPNRWRCRAGARYLYICESGLVHRCSQQRGVPGTPLLEYTQDDLDREYRTKKDCADYCTLGCVHAVSVFDNWRDPQGTENGVQRRASPRPERRRAGPPRAL